MDGCIIGTQARTHPVSVRKAIVVHGRHVIVSSRLNILNLVSALHVRRSVQQIELMYRRHACSACADCAAVQKYHRDA